MLIDYNIDFSNLLVIGGGLFATGKWLYEIIQKNKWEKNKFLLEKLEEFREKNNTKVFHQILDWNGSFVEVENEKFRVDDDLFISALDLHTDRHKFSREELLLRNTFDRYFDDLNTLYFMVKVGLVDEKHFKKFMDYWFKFFKGKGNKPDEFYTKIANYMKFYGYGELYDFICNNK
jgi:hypothetical protein